MGHLDQPLNTFWQLFFRPTGAKSWSNRASALAVATNGGLVLATDGGKALVVGIRTTNYLQFSPLIVTSNAREWTPATPISALVDTTDALARNARGDSLALVGEAKAAQVLASPGGLSGWRTLVTKTQLSNSRSGRDCGVLSLTAVGYFGDEELVGTSCSRTGTVGVFAAPIGGKRPVSWELVGPRLARSFGRSRSDVLGLEASANGFCALVKVEKGSAPALVAACTTTGATRWTVSPALPVTGFDDVVSFGPTGGLGLFTLVSGSAGRPELAVFRGSSLRWEIVPPPPPGTVTVAFLPGGKLDAFVVDDTVCTDWQLASGTGRWVKVQRMQVAIQFGSSS
jgi:hypothetical protein